MVIGHRAEIPLSHKAVERHGRAGRALEFKLRTIWTNLKLNTEIRHPRGNLGGRDFASERGEIFDFHNLEVTTKDRTLQRGVGINVEHPIVVMPHQTETVVRHRVGHPRRLDPCVNFIPAFGIVMQATGHLLKGNPRALENIRNFGNRTRRTMR